MTPGPDRRRSLAARALAVLAVGVLVASGTVRATAPDGQAARYLGIPLSSALQSLQASGLKIIYSSEMVRPGMRVISEPRSARPRDILDELLAPHGLGVKDGPRGALLVIKAAAPGSISGIVRDAGDDRPLPGAIVSIAGGGGSAVTTDDGSFSIPGLPPGRYGLEVRHASHLPRASDPVTVAAGRATEMVVSLTPRRVSSEEITVQASGNAEASGRPDARITQTEIRSSPGVQQDPLMAASRRAGSWSSEGSARMNLRGGADDEVLVMLDGLELDDPFHLKDDRAMFSIIDSRNVSVIDLYEGDFPASFGGRMSGVVDIKSTPAADARRVDVGTGSATSYLAGGGGFLDGRAHWMASARTGYPADQLEEMGVDPSYKPKFNDLFAKTEFTLGAAAKISVHLLAAGDELEGDHGALIETVHEPGTIRSRYSSRYAWVNLEQAWSPSLSSETIVSYGGLANLRNGSRPGLDEVSDSRRSSAVGLKQDWMLQAGRHVLAWGASARLVEAGYRYDASGTRPAPDPAATALPFDREISRRPEGLETALHLADSIRLTRWLDADVGVRWDRETYTGRNDAMISPRVSVVARAGESSSFRAGWGLYYQPQRIYELQVEDGISRFHPAERAEHVVAGLDHGFRNGLDLRVTAYRKRMTNVRPRYENLLDPFSYFPEARPDRVRVAPDGGLAQGVELEIGGAAGPRLHWRAGYALASAVDRFGEREVSRSWDQRHTALLTLGYRPAEGWDLALAGSYHSGRPWTPLAGGTPPPNGSEISASAFQEMNSARLPSAYRVDLLASKSFRLRQGSLRAYVDLTNIFDRANYSGIQGFGVEFEEDGQEYEDGSLAPAPRYGLPRTLSWGLAWSF